MRHYGNKIIMLASFEYYFLSVHYYRMHACMRPIYDLIASLISLIQNMHAYDLSISDQDGYEQHTSTDAAASSSRFSVPPDRRRARGLLPQEEGGLEKDRPQRHQRCRSLQDRAMGSPRSVIGNRYCIHYIIINYLIISIIYTI